MSHSEITVPVNTLMNLFRRFGTNKKALSFARLQLVGDYIAIFDIYDGTPIVASEFYSNLNSAISFTDLHTIYTLVKPFKNENLQITIDGDKAEFRVNKTACQVAIDTENTPTTVHDVFTDSVESGVNVDVKQLKDVMKGAAAFMAKQDVRYYLNGVLFQAGRDDTDLSVVSTDGHRLFCDTSIDWYSESPIRHIIHGATVTALNKALSGVKTGKVWISKRTDGGLVFLFSNGDIVAERRGVDGRYPDFSRVIRDTSTDSKVSVSVKEISNALKIATSSQTSKQFFEHTVRVGVNSDELYIQRDATSATTSLDMGIDYQPVQHASSEFFAGFNPAYLYDAIQAIAPRSDDAELSFHNTAPEHNNMHVTTAHRTCVVMPVRL